MFEKLLRALEEPSEEDLKAVERQLGRKPKGTIKIARRCKKGFPQVVFVYPLIREGGKIVPFPTLFWLTCPLFVKLTSKLEEKGFQNRADLVKSLREVNTLYSRLRKEALSAEDLKEAGKFKGFLELGVAGASSHRKVKCLHAHLANFLAGFPDPIGEAVKNAIGPVDEENCRLARLCKGGR